MKFPHVINENIKAVRDAFDLIESDVEQPDVVRFILNSLTHEEQTELTKGMFIAVKLLFRSTPQEVTPSTLRQAMSLEGEDGTTEQKELSDSIANTIIRLLLSMESDGGSFYLQLHSIKELPETVIQLIHIFKFTCHKHYRQDTEKDALKALTRFRQHVELLEKEKVKRDTELAYFLKLMCQNKEYTEKALRLMEILALHYQLEFTEDKEPVYFLEENLQEKDEVFSAFQVPDKVELLKGACIVTCAFLSLYMTVQSIIPLIEERRAQLMSETSFDEEDDNDIIAQHLALNLLTSIAMQDEDEFYQDADIMDDIYGIILSLNASLYRTCIEGLNRTTRDVAASMRLLLKD